MIDGGFQTMLSIWHAHASDLLLVCVLLLLFSGYPIAFILGGCAFLFALLGDQSGLLLLADYQNLPALIFNQILLDPALLSLPLLLFFSELMIETGQMAGLSAWIKERFQLPQTTKPDGGPKKRAWQSGPKRSKQKASVRSVFMRIFVPGAVLAILLARMFELPTEFVALGLLPILLVLSGLYVINWGLGLWVELSQLQFKQTWLSETAKAEHQPPQKPSRIQGIMRLLPPLSIGAGALLLLIHFRVSLFATLAILSLCLIVMALCQGRLGPRLLLQVMNRAAITTGAIAAILIAAYCFHQIYLDLGGALRLEQLASFILPGDTGPQPWAALLAILATIALLGLLFDWLILAVMIVPLLMPIFTPMDFNSLLIPKWAGIPTDLASIQPSNMLTANDIIIQAKLWFASLLWLSLMSALVTYAKHNGEIATKTLAPSVRKTQDAAVSLFLFTMLQLIGLGLCLIMPETVLWLPSLLIR